jgi:transporter family-2 protein
VDRGTAIVLTVAVGTGFAVQAPINSALGKDIGPLPAATVSFAAGTVILAIVTAAFGGGFGRIGDHATWWPYVAGGLIGAAVASVTLQAVGPLGARGMIACLLTGQLTMAAIIDQFGLLGVSQQPLTFLRGVGLVLLGAGVALVIGG